MQAKLTEGDHQLLLFRWARKQSLTIPELKMLFAIPNGGARSGSTGSRMKAEGVTPGVPDMMLAVTSRQFAGLFIELKTEKGRTSVEQDEWLRGLECQGYLAVVCRGAEEAYSMIVKYLGLQYSPQLLPLDLGRPLVGGQSLMSRNQPTQLPFES